MHSRQPQRAPWLFFCFIPAFFLLLLYLLAPGKITAHFWSFGDSAEYILIAKALATHDHATLLGYHKLLWGLPMSLVLGMTVLPLTAAQCLWGLSLLSGIGCGYFLCRLFGIRIAIAVFLLSLDWIQRMALGGAEPLFFLFILTSIDAHRRQSHTLASILAAFSCLVRPLGIFLLIAYGLWTLWTRQPRLCMRYTLTALLIGGSYLAFVYGVTGDLLAHFHGYQQADWDTASPIYWPLFAFWQGITQPDVPALNQIKIGAMMCFVLLSLGLLISRSLLRRNIRDHHAVSAPEWVFLWLYIGFVLCYNSSAWSHLIFPRLIIPVMPYLLIVWQDKLPARPVIYWSIGGLVSGLAAISVVNSYAVFSQWLLWLKTI